MESSGEQQTYGFNGDTWIMQPSVRWPNDDEEESMQRYRPNLEEIEALLTKEEKVIAEAEALAKPKAKTS